jgi:hypothetical protein
MFKSSILDLEAEYETEKVKEMTRSSIVDVVVAVLTLIKTKIFPYQILPYNAQR